MGDSQETQQEQDVIDIDATYILEDTFECKNMSPPATGGAGSGGGGDQKNQKGVFCPHFNKGSFMGGIRKAIGKCEFKIICSKDTCETPSAKQWMCLRCGHVGCGDDTGQGGHAKTHYATPRSDCHSLIIQLHGSLEKGWCFDCGKEFDTNTLFLKDCINFIRRHQKVKSALNQNQLPPIALGPPPPPPIPKLEPPKTFKTFSNKNKGNNNRNNNRWENKEKETVVSADWPLGLENLGNTCFMNSALQCLARTPTLIDKLDLWGSGNVLEICVSPEEPCIQIVNPNVDLSNGEDSGCASDADRGSNHIIDSAIFSADSSDAGSGDISPSTEIDSLLDAASYRSSRKSECEGGASCDPDGEKAILKKEFEKELSKKIKLRLRVPKESMTTKLKGCFKAITRSPNHSPETEEKTFNGRSYFTPRSIQLAVCKHFRLGSQHDSHELLRTVVDMMKKDEIKAYRLAIMQRYGVKRTDGKTCDPKLTELLKMWDRKLFHKTFIDEIFGGELVTYQTCSKCNNTKRSHEEFLDLSLPVRQLRPGATPITKKLYSLYDDDSDYIFNRTVEECLQAYTAAEILAGSNAVECDNCHRINMEKIASGVPLSVVFPDLKLDKNQGKQDNSKPSQVLLPSSIKSLSLSGNIMDVEEGPALPVEEEDDRMDENEQNNADDLMDDLDEPAVDGIGNASDVEEEEGNGVGPLDLGLGLEDKPISVADYLTVPPGNGPADEGFAEGENSPDDKPSLSLSGSSSHNSIFESENDPEMLEKTVKKIPVTKCPCRRQQLISRAPECLTLHLKRFQHSFRGSSKLGDKIDFPLMLNLTQFCSEAEEDVSKPGFKSTFDEDGEVVYSLYGIVEHSGSLHFGHYVAYVRVPGKPKESGELPEDIWYYISDAHATRADLDRVMRQEAYILFYERVRGPEKAARCKAYKAYQNSENDSWGNTASTSTYNYDKPVPSITTEAADNSSTTWEENWEVSGSIVQQVTSTNDAQEDMSITCDLPSNENESVDPVSSSTLYSCAGPVATAVDGVSSTTDTDTMVYSSPSFIMTAPSSSIPHPVWSEGERISPSLSEIMDEEESESHNANPVSSSSDVMSSPRSKGYAKLENVD